METNKYIDHTILKADATIKDIEQLCQEALTYDFASVCVNPTHVKRCAAILKDSDVKVCTVIGFPLGASAVKDYETKVAIADGADEVDMVINIGLLKSHEFDLVFEDIKKVVDAADGKCVKVIIETSLLSDEEKARACSIALDAKATFVKTSTGFSTGGATVEDVTLMKEIVQDNAQVKASGGVRSKLDFDKMVDAGATRIGTSNGVAIVTDITGNGGY